MRTGNGLQAAGGGVGSRVLQRPVKLFLTGI